MPDPVPRTCRRVLRGHHGAVNAVRFNAKGTYVMTCGQDRTVRLWNPHRDGLEAKGEALLVKTYEGRHGYDVQDVAIAHDNSKFASCGRDKAVFLWDVPTAKVIRKFEGHEHSVNCVRYNADATVLLSGSYDKTIRAWDLRYERASTRVSNLLLCYIHEKSFKTNANTAFYYRMPGIKSAERVPADPSAGRLQRQRDVHGHLGSRDHRRVHRHSHYLFSSNPLALILFIYLCASRTSCVDGIVRTFDLRAGALLREHIDEPVVSVALSPDARFLLAGCLDASIRLIDKQSGVERNSYRGHHMGSYRTESCFSTDGAFALSGSEDGQVYAWDVVSGQMDAFHAHGQPIRAIAAHPELPLLVTGCVDGSAKVWTNEG